MGMVSLSVIDRGRRRPPRKLPWPGALLVVLCAVVLPVGWLVWQTTSPGRSLRALSAGERHTVYERTMDDLRTLCGPQRPEALREHCRELAALVAPMEECGRDCEAIIRPILTPIPTR
jgi:hypothetical protein